MRTTRTGWMSAVGFGLIVCLMTGFAHGQRDTRSDLWVATDELGRALPGASIAGAPKTDRVVGLFYYIWLQETAGWQIHDISKILAGEQTWGGVLSFHHYGESLYGYYSSADEYVIRRHIQMITDAGVDFIYFDNTNGGIYEDVQRVILDTIIAMKAEGRAVPKVSWAMYNGAVNAEVETLYDTIIATPAYRELFFEWDGKPLLLGFYTGGRAEVAAYFTFRKSWAWTNQPWFTETEGKERWPWLDNYPQNPGLDGTGAVEQMTVAAAQHPHGEFAIGKSTGADITQAPVYGTEGRYFGLQWERALEVDPPLVMVTQWNEWVAQRFIKDDPDWNVNGVSWMARQPLSSGDSIFIDVYTPEYSRDLEPMRTAYRDNMYLQLVANVRRYKGVGAELPPAESRTMSIPGDFSQWDAIDADYLDDLYDVTHRDHASFGSDTTYTNTTGRNDFEEAKAIFDADSVTFYVKTREAITAHTDPLWMLLLINADQDYATGWSGYDFIVNHAVTSENVTTIQSFAGPGFVWETPVAVDYQVVGNELMVEIPAAVLGVDPSLGFSVDFKWVDNAPATGDILDFYVDGDAAPNGRFNYRFTAQPFVPIDTDSGDNDSDADSSTGDSFDTDTSGDDDTDTIDSETDTGPEDYRGIDNVLVTGEHLSGGASCGCETAGVTSATPTLLQLLLRLIQI